MLQTLRMILPRMAKLHYSTTRQEDRARGIYFEQHNDAISKGRSVNTRWRYMWALTKLSFMLVTYCIATSPTERSNEERKWTVRVWCADRAVKRNSGCDAITVAPAHNMFHRQQMFDQQDAIKLRQVLVWMKLQARAPIRTA